MGVEQKKSKDREKQEKERNHRTHSVPLPPHHLTGYVHLCKVICEESKNLKSSNIFIFSFLENLQEWQSSHSLSPSFYSNTTSVGTFSQLKKS